MQDTKTYPLETESFDRHDIHRIGQNALQAPRQLHRLYELVLIIAVVYGLAIFLIWQRIEQRMVAIEDDLLALQDDFKKHQSKVDAGRIWDETQIVHIDDSNPLYRPIPIFHFETKYLHFEANHRFAELVRAIAEQSNEQYRKLSGDFRLAIDSPNAKLRILIGTSGGNSIDIGENLVIPWPESGAVEYRTTEASVNNLRNEVFNQLSDHVRHKASQESQPSAVYK